MPVSRVGGPHAMRVSRALQRLAVEMERLAQAAEDDKGSDHPELEEIAEELEAAAEALGAGVREGVVSAQRLGRVADAFTKVGAALGSGL